MKVNNHKHGKKNATPRQLFDLQSLSIQELLQKAIKAYQQSNNTSTDRWNMMLSQSGTKKDKISAAGALILENPLRCLQYIDMLIKWCFDRNHNFAISACQGLGNIYADHLLAGKSSLKDFSDSIQSHIKQNKKNAKVTQSELISFYIQSQLKQYYSEFIKSIQLLLNDELTHIKKSCIKILGGLAKYKELRRTILALVINKLGDTDMQVVNQVSKSLKDEFYQDILASQTLMEETEGFLFRSNLPPKAQFFVINFLNNINLKFLNQKTLRKLFEIFYHFFTKTIAHENEDQLGSRLFLNSIKGLNKVFSFMRGGSKQTKKSIQQKLQDVYKIVHTTPNVKAKIQLLLFLFQSQAHLNGNISSNNRFYRVLYEFISTNEVTHSSLGEMFFDLVLVSMKEDENLNRILAFSKRMLQLCFSANSNFVVTTLLMLDKVIQSNEGFQIFLGKQENCMEDDPEKRQIYDMNKRDPLFSGAEKTNLWELRAFASHYHPTIRKFAQSILKGKPIQYQGSNPLLEFNLTSFVEKMSLRKEKKSQAWRIKVKRNLSKIRTSKYSSLLNKQLTDFKEDQQFIKKYLEKRNTIHINRKKITTNDIEEFADDVIMKEMDRLNPKDDDEQLSITPLGSQENDEDNASWDQEGGEEGVEEGQMDQFEEDEMGDMENNQYEENEEGDQQIDDDLEFNEDGSEVEESGVDQKQFEDVFNQIEGQDEFEHGGRGKKRNDVKKRKDIKKKKDWKKGGGKSFGREKGHPKGREKGKGRGRK